ncbi:MAG: hypothetical protein AAF577_00440 [Pseudomonadota bacterium]
MTRVSLLLAIFPAVLLLAACQPSAERSSVPVRAAPPSETAAERRLADWTAALEAPLGAAGQSGLTKTDAEAAAAVEAARAVLGEKRSTLSATRARVLQSRLPQSALDSVIADARQNVATMRRAARACASRRGSLAGTVSDAALADLDRRARSLGELASALEAEL